MRLPPPSLLALHMAMGVPLIALGVWFGAIDQLPVGEDRCASCGVEGYVIAAHVVAAVWLGAVVAATAAARRRVREGVPLPAASRCAPSPPLPRSWAPAWSGIRSPR